MVQRGVTVRLALRGSPHKGWGVVATAPIAQGAFVCEYAGELLTNQQAAERQAAYDGKAAGNYLMVVREVLPSTTTCLRTNVDAT